MKRLKIGIIMLVLVAFGTGLRAQSQEKIDQDIAIAENILQTLLYEDRDNGMWISGKVEGEYVEGYGAIFSLPSSPYSFITYRGSGSNTATIRSNGEAVVIVDGKRSKREVNTDSVSGAYRENVKNAVITFLADYGKLMSGLPENERIMVTDKGKSRSRVFISESTWDVRGDDVVVDGSESRKNSRLVMEVSKSDITQYEQGKINRKQFIERIEITENDPRENLSTDLELFSSIINRLYSRDLSETYYMSGDPNYERITKLGVIYNFRVYSSVRNDQGYYMPTINEDRLSKKEREEKVVELYPMFVESIKSNMIEYGRTITSLEPDEMLMFKIRLTECEGCSIPKNVDISVKASVLQQFDSRKIDLQKAKGSIKVKEYPQ